MKGRLADGFLSFSYISNWGLSVGWDFNYGGVGGFAPDTKNAKGGGVGGGNALRRAAEAARKSAITRSIWNKENTTKPLCDMHFSCPCLCPGEALKERTISNAEVSLPLHSEMVFTYFKPSVPRRAHSLAGGARRKTPI